MRIITPTCHVPVGPTFLDFVEVAVGVVPVRVTSVERPR